MSTKKQPVVYVDANEMARIIRSYRGGHIFGVEFVKKDGSIRKMSCRHGVHKGVKGVGLKYDPLAKGLISVFDVNSDGFRMINADTLRCVNIDGFRFQLR